jgi:hypothetical protein
VRANSSIALRRSTGTCMTLSVYAVDESSPMNRHSETGSPFSSNCLMPT